MKNVVRENSLIKSSSLLRFKGELRGRKFVGARGHELWACVRGEMAARAKTGKRKSCKTNRVWGRAGLSGAGLDIGFASRWVRWRRRSSTRALELHRRPWG